MKIYLRLSLFLVFLGFADVGFAANPVASNLRMTGAMEGGFTLEVFYDFTDGDGDSEAGTTYQWFTHPNRFSPPGAGTPIPGATGKTFTIPSDNSLLGLHISVIVTPRDDNAEIGAPVEYMDWSGAKDNPVLTIASSCQLAGGVGPVAPDNGFLTIEPLCGPRDADWRIRYTGIDYRFTNIPVIIVDWGDGNTENFFPTLLNPNETKMQLQEWQVVASHTYDYGGVSAPPVDGSCTFQLTTSYGVFAGGTVTLACPEVNAQEYTVWDDISNADLGTHDVNHDNSTAGNEVGETVELCEGDNSVVRLEDVSEFNCRIGIEPNNPNQESRWIQWVYGSTHNITTGAGPTEKIIINGVSYDDTDFPLYGTPTQQVGPGVLAPNGITDDIQMPTTSNNGESFVVTLRSWNTCNPFSLTNDLSPPQGIGSDVFRYYGPGGTNQLPLVGAVGDFANDDPITRIFTINIVTSPPPPVAINNTTCTGVLPLAEVDAASISASATAINFYNSDPTLGGATLLQSSMSTTYSPGTHASDPAFDTSIGNTRSYFVTQVGAGIPACESLPVEVIVTVREALNQPGVITGTSPICDGTDNVSFSVAAAPGNNPFGGAIEYQWSSTGGGGVNLDATTGNNITVDFNIGGSFTSVTRTIRVRRIYSSAPTCPSNFRTFTVTIFGTTEGGTTGPDNEICEGDNTGSITLNGEFGTILNWERQVNGGGFIDIGNNGNDTFSEVLATEGTYEYRAVVDNGPCLTQNSTITTITVNPIPATPTISEVGDGTDICENGDQVILQSSNTDGNADEYAWFNVLDLVTPVQQSASNQLILTSPAESGSYRVQVIGINPTNCESPLSAPIDVVINPLPTADVSGGGSVCAGIPGPPAVITLTGTGPWNVTYERNGNATTANGVTSPYVIPGSTVVTDNPDTYVVTSVTDLGTTVNCTVTAPSANITGSATIATSIDPPPTIDDFSVGAPVCDDGVGTALPSITLDLFPDAAINYNVEFEIFDGTLASQFTRIINRSTDGTGTFVFNLADLDYADLSNTPDSYTIRLLSIINTASGCNAAGLPVDELIVINPRPADPTNPVGATACSSDPTGATLSVDDPGPGFVVRWYTAYTDESTNTPAVGVTGGSNEETFTPTSNATQTYITVIESNTAPTNCHSVNTLDVEHIQDLLPTAADADLDNDVTLLETCTDELLLGAIAADNGGTGTWTFPGLLFYEDFNGFSDGTYQSLGTFGWSRDISTTAFDDPTDHFEVRSNAFEANDLNGEGIWNSEPIDISAIANFDISIDAIEVGDHEGTDYIQLWYQIDANAEQMVGQVTGNFGTAPISGTIPTGGGTNVVIRIKVLNNANAEFLSFDNVSLTDAAGTLLTFDDIHDENATVSGLPVGVTTLTWSVASALGSCSPTTETVDVKRNPLPTANDITPELCDEIFGNPLEVTGVDLTIALYSDAITGIVGSVNRSIAYFDDPSRNIADLIPDPTDVDISDLEVVYVRVTDTDPSLNTTCTSDSEITFTVHPLPAVTEPTLASRTFCEDVQGSGSHAGVDLDTYNAQISGTTTITWFPSLADAQAGSNQIAAGAAVGQVGNFTVFGGNSVFARAEDANGCANFQEVAFVTSPLPVDNTITGNAIDCSSATAVKIYQMDATLNAFGSTHVYNWTVTGGAGVNFEVFDGTTFTTTNNYTVTQASFLLLLRFPNPGTFTITGSETIDGCTGNDVQRIVNISGAPPALVFDAPETQVCKGETGVTYSLVGGAQAGSNYVWTVIGGTIVGPGSGNIATITVNWGTTTAPQPSVSVTESNATGCTGAPVSVNVFLNDVPVMTSANSTTICSDDSPSSNINFTATVGGAPPINPITFNWTITSVSPNISGVVLGQTGIGNLTDVLTNISGIDGIVEFSVVPTENELPVNPACEGAAQLVTVTVKSEPRGTADAVTTCSDDALNYDLVANVVAANGMTAEFTYVVASSDAGNVPAAAGRAVASNANITDTYTNETGVDVFITYTVTPIETVSGNICEGNPFDIVFTIESEPVGTDDAVTTCSDDALNYDLVANVVAANGMTAEFTYVVASSDAGNVPAAAGRAVASNANITDTYTNETGVDVFITYTVTPIETVSGNICEGNPFDIVFTIESEPVGTDDAVTTCSDDALNYDLVANVVAANGMTAEFTYVVASSDAGNVPAAAGRAVASNANITDTYTNETGVDVFITYTVTPIETVSGNICEGNPFDIVFTIESEPVGTDDAVTTCSDDALNYDLVANVVAANGMTAEFTYVVASSDAGNVPAAAGRAVASNANITDTYTNETGVDVFITYTVTPIETVSGNICEGNPFDIVFTIESEPVGTDDAVTTCSDDALNYDLVANVVAANGMTAEFTYVVASSDAGNVPAAAGRAVASNANITDTYTNETGVDVFITYTVTPIETVSGNICEGNPFDIVFTIESEPVGTDDAVTTCSDDALNYDLVANVVAANGMTAEFTYVVASSDAGNVPAAAGRAVASNANITDTYTNETGVDVFITYTVTPIETVSGNICEGNPFDIVFTIESEPVGTDDAVTTCSDDALNYDLVANVVAANGMTAEFTYVVASSDAGNVPAAAGRAVASNANITDTYTNETGVDVFITYTVTPIETVSGNICEGNPFDIVFTIESEPVGTDDAVTTCSDDALNYDLVANVVAANGMTAEFTYVVASSDAGNVPAAAGRAVASNANITDTYTNETGVDVFITYTVTPIETVSGNICEGNPFDIVFTIESEPVGTDDAVTTCSDDALNYDLVANVVAANGMTAEFTYVVASSDAGNVPAAAGRAVASNANITDTYTNETGVDVFITYTVTPIETVSGNICEGNPFDIVFTIESEPVGTDDAVTTCSDDALNYDLVANVVAANGMTAEFTYVVASSDAGNVPAAAGRAVASNANITDTYTNETGVDVFITYTVTPIETVSGNICEGNPFDIVFTIESEPVGTDDAVTTCSDDALNYDLVANVVAANGMTAEFTYVVASSDAGNVPAAAGRAVASNANITDTYTNETGVDVFITYTVTPIETVSGNICEGNPFDIVFTIESEPVGADQSFFRCSDATLAYNIQTQNINVTMAIDQLSHFTYTVTSSDQLNVPAAADRIAPSIDPITDGYINDTGTDVTITYTITPIGLLNSCVGDPFDVEFVYGSKPKGFNDVVEECSDVALNYDIQTLNINDAVNGNSMPSDFTYTVVSSSGSVPPGPNRTVKSALPITDTYTNNTGAPVDITYTIVPISQGTNCTGNPFTVTFTIQSEPLGSDSNIDVCGGGAINFDLQGQITNGIASRFYYSVTSSSPGDVAPDPDRPVGSASTANITTSYNNSSGAPVLITYTVTPIANDATNCEGNPFLVRFNIIPGPEGADDTDTYCSGEAINYNIQTDNVNVLGNSIPGKYTYTVTSLNPGAISIVPGSLDRLSATAVPITDVFTNETAGNATVRYTITPISDTGGCVGTPFDVDFVIQPAPNGEDDLGNIICSGEPVTYDFQVDNIDTFNGLASEFSYTVVSSDPVNVPADPNSPFGAAATINTSYLNTTSSPVFITYTVTPRETGSGDNCEGEPFDVRFQINPEPVLNPSLDNTVCSKENSDITFATNGTSVNALNYIIDDLRIPAGLTAQPGNVAVLPGGVNAAYIRNDQYENLTNGPLTVEYDVIPVSSAGCQGDLVTVLLEVLPEPVLDPALSPTPVCSGLPSGVVLSEEAGSIAAVTYNINGISVPAGLTASAGNAIIGDGQSANAIQNDTFINTTSVPLQVIYTITPVSADGCEGDDQAVTFTINPSPAIASNLDKTVCYDEASGIVFNTASTSAAAVSYDITNVVIAAGLTQTAGNTGVRNGVATTEVSLDQFENNTNNPLTVTYTVRGETAAGCTGPTNDIVLTVEPQITASPVNNNPTICSTSLTDIDLLSPTTPTSGVITFNYTAVSSIGGQLSGFQPVANNLPLGYKIEDNLVNNSDNAATVTYTITAVANGAKSGTGCTGPSVDVVVIVEPKPKVEASSIFETVCEGESLAIDLTSPTVLGSGTLEFEVTSVVETGGVTGFSPLGTTFNNGDQLADLLDNPTTSDQTVTYQITPRATGTLAVNDPCEGDPVTIVVTVRPRPTVTPSVNDVRICSGEIVNISLPTDVANSIAAWTVSSNANVIGQFDGLGGSLFQSLINTSSTQQVLTYTVEPFLLLDNGCTGPVETITVTIDPVPDVIINESQMSICAGETVDILLDGNTPNTTYIVKASSTNPDISGYVADTLVNGESINQVIAHTGTTPGTILYTITPQIIQPAPDVDPCAGLPQVVIVTVSPPVSAEILTEDEILCIGNNKAIEFQLAGSAPFKLTLEKTDAAGVVTTEILENLATRHVILASETVSYRIVEMEDFYTCVVNPSDEVNIVFEQAEADFTINGSKNPEAVTLDFNSGAVTVDIVVNNFQPANTYKLQIGDDILLDDEISASFQYTFTSPSEFGTLGYSVELQVESPNANNCNDVENFFIEVLPAQPTVVGVADILEGCPPFTVNFESFREDLSLSKNVIVEDLTWTIDGNTLRTPNPTFTFTERGVYNVRVEGDNGHGDTATDELVITVFDKPSAIFEITQTVVYIPDDGFRPTNRSQRASEYEWDFGDFSFGPENQQRSPEHFYEEEGKYYVTLNVKNEFGCMDMALDSVLVEEGGFTKTPNAFTPSLFGPSGGADFDPTVPGSGDAANDIFLPITNGVTDFKMYIYDRWGNLIFFSDSKKVGWDGYNSKGQLLPPGVYVYKLDLILSSGQRTTRVGDVTLIR